MTDNKKRLGEIITAIHTLHRKTFENEGRHLLVTRAKPDGSYLTLAFVPPKEERDQEIVEKAFNTAYAACQVDTLAATNTPTEKKDSPAFIKVVLMVLVARIAAGCESVYSDQLARVASDHTAVIPLDFAELFMQKFAPYFPNVDSEAFSVLCTGDVIYLDNYVQFASPDSIDENSSRRMAQCYAMALEQCGGKKPSRMVYIEKPSTQQAIMLYLTDDILASANAVAQPLVDRFGPEDAELAFQQAASAIADTAETAFTINEPKREEGSWQLIATPQSMVAIMFLIQARYYPAEEPATLAIINEGSVSLTRIAEDTDASVTP